MSARALEFLILTASRTGEALGARWDELDLVAGAWTIPASRIKAGREHRVALSSDAKRLLGLQASLNSDWVFPARNGIKPLSNMALLALLRRMRRRDITVHGFRSTFRDWVAECTNHQREVAEAALAHALENRVEAAYRRGDLFSKRVILMEDWAHYCACGSKISFEAAAT